jgi:hypothetical protein
VDGGIVMRDGITDGLGVGCEIERDKSDALPAESLAGFCISTTGGDCPACGMQMTRDGSTQEACCTSDEDALAHGTDQ